jgi:hypothetical protein
VSKDTNTQRNVNMKRPAEIGVDHLLQWHPKSRQCKFNVVQLPGMHVLAELHDRLPACWNAGKPDEYVWCYGEGGSKRAFHTALEGGDTQAASEVREMAEEMAREVRLHGHMPEFTPAVAGGPVVVPAALSGSPLAFNRTDYREDATAPLRIFMPLGLTAAYSAADVRNIMVAQIALAASLSAARPVQLVAYAGEHVFGAPSPYVLTRIPIGMSPMDWGVVAALAQTGMFRDLIFKLSCYGSLYREGQTLDNLQVEVPSRKDLGADEKDLVLKRGDAKNVALNPIAWVKKQIEKVNRAANVQQ